MELQIPTGLTDMLQEFTVVVLRERPEDMVDFAANYFTQLKLQNKGSENAKGVSFHSDQKESDEEDDEEEPLGSLNKFHTMTFVILCNSVLYRILFIIMRGRRYLSYC